MLHSSGSILAVRTVAAVAGTLVWAFLGSSAGSSTGSSGLLPSLETAHDPSAS